MSFLITCPNCGSRPVDEFRFGGELRTRPDHAETAHAWRAYLYERANVKGRQEEWWYHRQGCRRWLIAVRDTQSNTVLETAWIHQRQGDEDAETRDARSATAAGDDVSGLE